MTMTALPPHPATIAPNFDAMPPKLTHRDQWVLWRWEWDGARWTKVPYQPNGTNASTTNPATWSAFTVVTDAYQAGGFDGVGFVFTEADPYVGIDLDHVLEPGVIDADASLAVVMINTYTEMSVSGTGLHLIGEGQLPPSGRKKGRVEMYDRGRFFTMTGHVPDELPAEIRPINDALTALHERIFGESKATATTERQVPHEPSNRDDADVLDRARRAANGSLFTALFDRGDTSGHGDDDSAADLALANLLRFWTGADPHQMDRLFRQSALYRPKWDERRGQLTYGEMTIAKALPGETYSPSPAVLFPAPATTPDAEYWKQRALAAEAERDEVRAINRGMLAILRSDAKPAVKVANIELAIEAHTPRREDFTCNVTVARRIHQSDDTVSSTLKAQRVDVAPDQLRAGGQTAPFVVALVPRMSNPWTGEITDLPRSYMKLVPSHDRVSETMLALADVPEELKKKERADRGTKATPKPIADELIPPCPDDDNAGATQQPEQLQVARCKDCGMALAAMTEDGELLTLPSTDNIGRGDASHGAEHTCGSLSYLTPDIIGRGQKDPPEGMARCIHCDKLTKGGEILCWSCDYQVNGVARTGTGGAS